MSEYRIVSGTVGSQAGWRVEIPAHMMHCLASTGYEIGHTARYGERTLPTQ